MEDIAIEISARRISNEIIVKKSNGYRRLEGIFFLYLIKIQNQLWVETREDCIRICICYVGHTLFSHSGQIIQKKKYNLGKPHYLPQRQKSTFFKFFRMERPEHKEACGVKKFFQKMLILAFEVIVDHCTALYFFRF